MLFLPFDKGVLPFPDAGKKTLIWGAEYDPQISKMYTGQWIQSFKPYADIIKVQGLQIAPVLSGDRLYSIILCNVPKQKEAAKYRLARSVISLEDGGVIVAAAANDAGGKRLEKWFKELGLKPFSLSKSKCRVVWAAKGTLDTNFINQFLEYGEVQKIKSGDQEFLSKAGVYGWNKIDAGSEILSSLLPSDLRGIGADFGCGYGYLSQAVLRYNQKISKLYAFDAEYEAVELCQKNLAGFEQEVECLWHDLAYKPDGISPLDWIIMNPPFHEGKETNIDIGQKFIKTASASLRKNGPLMVVANAHLPYEEILNQEFSAVDKVTEEQGFKVFKAIK